jgi:uncharacterized protein with NRDE domain
MCTLLVLHRCFPGAPLVVAANRDEFHERPTEEPALRDTSIEASAASVQEKTRGTKRARRVVAPRDLRAGGTWLGINSKGLFAAVTNRRCENPDASRRSRGWLVMEALEEDDAKSAAARLESLPEAAYNPFNLLVADAASAHLVTYADAPERSDLAPGPHVIGNVHPDETSPKLARIRAELAGGAASDTSFDGLAGICRTHVPAGPVESTCVHAGPYGTRSSTLLRLGDDPALHYADGAPCEAPYRDLTPLLHDLGIFPSREGVQA